jgi:hypothetical protein
MNVEYLFTNNTVMSLKNILELVFILSLVVSCTDCDSSAYFYKNEECSLLISNQSGDIRKFYSGKDPFTGKGCDCKDGFRLYSVYRNHMDIGDTLIKKKGELFFTVHKKDTVLKFDWKCEGKVYK